MTPFPEAIMIWHAIYEDNTLYSKLINVNTTVGFSINNKVCLLFFTG